MFRRFFVTKLLVRKGAHATKATKGNAHENNTALVLPTGLAAQQTGFNPGPAWTWVFRLAQTQAVLYSEYTM